MKNLWLMAYRGESKYRPQFSCLYDFQSHHPLRLLLLHVKYIQLQRESNNLHGFTIKTIFGLQLVQMQVKTERYWFVKMSFLMKSCFTISQSYALFTLQSYNYYN